MIPCTGFYKQETLYRRPFSIPKLPSGLCPKDPWLPHTPSHHNRYLKSLFSLVFPQPLSKHTLRSHLYPLHPKTPPQVQSAVARFQLYPPPEFYASSYLRSPSATADFPNSAWHSKPMLAFWLQRLPTPVPSQMKSLHAIHIKANISEKGFCRDS